MKFKGFDDYIEIFRGGKQVDSEGREHDGDKLIERALATFDPDYHEPPAVVGHPADNAPAFGWVESLKEAVTDGTRVLLARFKQVVPEFADMVKAGLFKKRSASFYPDGRLRHVGFLGAAAPAVKGLADVAFGSDAEHIDFEYENHDPEGNENINHKPQTTNHRHKEGTMKFSDFWEIFKFWKQVEKDPDIELDRIGETARSPHRKGNGDAQFTEADLEQAKKDAAAEERQKAESEFAEKARTAQQEAREQEISAWCDTQVEQGKVAPAWVKSGIKAFMQKLDGETEIEFAEGEKSTGLEWFKNFIAELPKLVAFTEIAARDKDADIGDDLVALATEIQKKEEITFNEALRLAAGRRPDLFNAWLMPE